MVHHTYKTTGFVLRKLPRGDADCFVELYTKEFGFMYAQASGLRKGQSKLRYALQAYSLSEVALVKGRAGWRIVGAVPYKNYFYETAEKALVARLFSVMKLFSASEEQNKPLYDILLGALRVIEEGKSAPAVEVLAMVRILHVLGYVNGEIVSPYVDTHEWSESLLGEVHEDRISLTRLINSGIEASQL